MGYTEEIFIKARDIMDKRRDEAENALLARMEFLAGLDPEYSACKKKLIDNSGKIIQALDKSEKEADRFIRELERDSLETVKNISAILKRHGLPEDYLKEKYTCPVCEDTGSVGTRLCGCMIELLKKLTADEEGKKSPLKFSTFEDFSLSYYSEAKSDALGGKSPRERMGEIYRYCRDYAARFDTDSTGICMYGETGLGKTHLSLAIASDVIAKGYSVIYNSAQNIFNRLNQIQFGKTDDTTFEAMVMGCDLLVIDDLGAEFQTSFTKSAIYNILNTRMNSGLPTIISTNIDINEIADYYGKRVASRIFGEFQLLKFVGEDIRQKKKHENA